MLAVCQELSRLLRCEDSAANSIVAGAAAGACLIGLQRKHIQLAANQNPIMASQMLAVQVEKLQLYLQHWSVVQLLAHCMSWMIPCNRYLRSDTGL